MIRAAAGDYIEPAYALYIIVRKLNIVKHYLAAVDSRTDCVADCLWLLHYLLEHKMLVAALFRRSYIPFYLVRLLCDFLFVHVEYAYAVLFELYNLVIL